MDALQRQHDFYATGLSRSCLLPWSETFRGLSVCTWGATFTVCPKRLFQCSAASGAQLKTLEPTRKQMLQTQQQLRRASVTWDTVAAPHNPTKLDGTQVMRLQQEVVVELLESTTGDELRMTGFLCWFPFWLGAWGALGGSLEGALGCPFLGGTSWACFAFFSCRGRGGGGLVLAC